MLLVVVVRRRRRRMLGYRHSFFGARRVGGESLTRITADDLAEVFDPPGFKNEWTPGEVERVVKALPNPQLQFDASNVVAAIETLDKLVPCASGDRNNDHRPLVKDHFKNKIWQNAHARILH